MTVTRLFMMLFLSSISIGAYANDVDSVGDVAEHFVDSGTFQATMDLFSGFCYVLGAWFGIKTLTQLKDHNDSPGQVKLSKPGISMVVSTMLLTLPSIIDAFALSLAMNEGTGVNGVIGNLGSIIGLGQGTSSCISDTTAKAYTCIARSVPDLLHLVAMGGVVMGAFFIIKGIFMLPTMEQGRATGAQVMWTLLAGVLLWSLLPMFNTISSTMGGQMSTSNFSGVVAGKYAQSQSGGNPADQAFAASLLIVQLIGMIAFTKGLYMLKLLGENKDGSMGRAMTHIFGGAASMNIVWTIKVLAGTLGMYESVCKMSSVLCRNTASFDVQNSPINPSVLLQIVQTTSETVPYSLVQLAQSSVHFLM